MNNLKPNNTKLMPSEIKSSINFTQNGSGNPILLIHGIAASLHDWNDLIPELDSAGYEIFALDLPGHGKSGGPDDRVYSIANVLAAFSDWIESLPLDKPLILVGHSLGAYFALQYTLCHPERVRALVLCDPLYNLDQLPFLLRFNYRHGIIDTSLIEHLPEWIIKRAVDLTSLSIRDGYELSADVRKQTAADYKRAQPGIFNIFNSLPDLSAQLHLINQPALVLWGARDSTLAPASFSKILQLLPNSRGSIIKDAGHVPHQSHSVEFNRRVMEFLHSLSISG
jgi:pimeloyl-ACP methyl ester carboxylesterase